MVKLHKKTIKPAFTLIEMLVASTIFAIVVLISAGVFGSGAKMQQTTKSSVNNQELTSLITNKMFDDLKSSTGWGSVNASVDNNSNNQQQQVQIKGIAFLQYTSSNLRIRSSVPEGASTANLIIGVSGSYNSANVVAYYFSGNSLYKTTFTRNFTPLPTGGGPLTVADFANIDIPDNEVKTDLSTIQSIQITGNNYISNNAVGDILDPKNKVQSLINLDLTVVDKSRTGAVGTRLMETKTSFSSRNYLEEIR